MDSAKSIITIKPMLNEQQQVTSNAILEWIENGIDPFRVLCSDAGTGKTYLTNATICNAFKQRILPQSAIIYTTALIHTAVGVIDRATPNIPNKGASTVHSLFGLRPQRVNFSRTDEKEYQRLLDIKSDQLSYKDKTKLHFLGLKREAADSKTIEFVQNSIPKAMETVRLVIVDEAGQLSEYVFDTIRDTIFTLRDKGHNIQCLFLGDDGQTPPVGEKESLVFKTIVHLPRLTEIVRYGGDILTLAKAIKTQPNYNNLHLSMSFTDETVVTLSADEIFDKETLCDCYKASPDTIFVTSTNLSVDTINRKARKLLTGKRKLDYQPGDILLTNSGVYRNSHSEYGFGNVSFGDPEFIFPSSTFIQIVREATEKDEAVHLSSYQLAEHLNPSQKPIREYTNALGHTYTRSFWIAKVYNYAEKKPDGTVVEPEEMLISLIDPNQYSDWKKDDELLTKIAKSSRSSSDKQKRGQEGDYAKAAWDILKIKNWYKFLDGNTIGYNEYRSMTSQLWNYCYSNKNFADPVTYSYACTVHRIQGMGVACIIADLNNILGITKPMWQKATKDDGTWDVRKLYYTAVTRAKEQCILMI